MLEFNSIQSGETAIVDSNPFAVLTFIVAPALLTNASSVLALSTTNRMLRTRDRMQEMYAQGERQGITDEELGRLLGQVDRVEAQAELLLSSLHAIYLALGAFSSATLVTLLGAALSPFQGAPWFNLLAGLGLLLGFIGVGGLAFGSICLFRATRLSLIGIHQEAVRIRELHALRHAHLVKVTGSKPAVRVE